MPRGSLAVAAALLLLLAACTPKAQKAQGNEGLYDRLMSVQAYPPARAAILKSIAIQPDEPRYWMKLAQVEQALTNYNGAYSAYQHVADLQPDNIEALEALSVLAVRGGDTEAAKRYTEPLLLLQPDNVSGLLVQGAVAIAENRQHDAERIADKMIAANSMREEAYLLKARALAKMGRTPEAAELMEQRVKLNSADPQLLEQLLSYRRALGQRDAIQALSIRLARLNPENPQYVIESARAFHAQGRDDLSRSALDDLKQRYAASVPVMKAIAGYWRDMAPPAVARKEIAALAVDATRGVRTALADALIAAEDPAGALTLTTPLVGNTIDSSDVDVATIHARALVAVGRVAEARTLIDRIIAFDATNTLALILRARLELGANDLGNALNDAQLAASGDLNNEEAQILVAQIYAKQGNTLLAGQTYGGAQRHFPNSPSAMRANAAWLISQGKKAQAINTARSYLRAHAGMSAARTAYVDVCKAAGGGTCDPAEAIRPPKLF
jgi:tetratricopeptide (TPR) repeat protein